MIRTLGALLVAGFLVTSNAASSATCACSGCTALDCSEADGYCAAFNGAVSSCSGSVVTCTDIPCQGDDPSDCQAGCAAVGCTGSLWSCMKDKKKNDGANDCFHEDTTITYKDGTTFTLDQLLSNPGTLPDCSVPHVVSSIGVRIDTSCRRTLRVSDTHLVATSRGFQLAYSLKPGDVLFGDFNGDEQCVIESVDKEKGVQKYFGLNCLHSEVLANGIRTSTFGDFHTLPSWYMYYAGNIAGVDTASWLGNYIAEWYYGSKN